MQLIQQGLKITTNKHYVKFTKSKYYNVVEDEDLDCITIYFNNLSSGCLVDKRIEVLVDRKLIETDYTKIVNPTYKLDGVTITKLTPHDYTFRQFIVEDIDSFIMSYNEYSCTILIPKNKIFRLDSYKDTLSKNIYLKVLTMDSVFELHDLPSVNLRDEDIELTSAIDTIFNSKKYYQRYLLDRVTTEKSFIDQLTTIVREYGMDMIRYPIDSNVSSVNHIVWRFTDIGKQLTHKSNSNPLRYAIRNKDEISLEISCPDLVILNDFKTKYQNLEFLSNFTTFYTKDKLSRDWLASVKWSELPTDFNQDHDTDNQGNEAFKLNITAEIEYYVVEDVAYRTFHSIILNVVSEAVNGSSGSNENIIIN